MYQKLMVKPDYCTGAIIVLLRRAPQRSYYNLVPSVLDIMLGELVLLRSDFFGHKPGLSDLGAI